MTTKIFFAALIGSVALFALAACSGESEAPPVDDSNAGAVASPQPTPTATVADEVVDAPVVSTPDDGSDPAVSDDSGLAGRLVDGVRELVELPAGDQAPVVVNVSFRDGDVFPKRVAAPVDRQVQLVLRNHDQSEHHYHINGMPTDGIRWLSKEGDDSLNAIPQEEHAAHHPEVSLVPFHVCTSSSGICPTGEWIHAHADPADMDMIIFVPNLPGTYEVTDPLHPDVSGKFTVFGAGGRSLAAMVAEADARAAIN